MTLQLRLQDAVDQLDRYGGPFCEEIVEAVEIIADINDNLYHGRAPELTQDCINSINRVLAKALMESTRSRT